MYKSINRYQLFFLLFLSLINLISFIWGSSVPDNIYEINSSYESFNFISFYLSSFVSFVSFYVGSWIIVPLLLSSFVYSFYISRREIASDCLITLSICSFFFCLAYTLFPTSVGNGLLYFVNNYISSYVVFIISLVSLVVTFNLILRKSFLDTLQYIQLIAERSGKLLWQKVLKLLILLKI